MLTAHYQAMARYNRWMNARLYELAESMTDEERKRDLGAFFKSIHGTLNHLLLADRAWIGRFTGDRALAQSRDANGEVIEITGLAHELYSDFAMLRREREKTDADIERFVSTLDEARLAQEMSYKTTSGLAFQHPTWIAVSHFFNHQTHHRGQVTTLFNQLGRDPGVTDLVVFLRDD